MILGLNGMSNLSKEQLDSISKVFSDFLDSQQKEEVPLSQSCIDNSPVNKPSKYMQDFERGKVLFVGTGAGWEVLHAQDMGFDAYGITLGKDNIIFGRENLGLAPEKFVEGPNESLPFGSETFDFVAGFQIFEHCIAPSLFLIEQHRVLKPGGVILLEWPPSHPTSSHDPKHQICFTPGQAEALLWKTGFDNVQLFYSHYPTGRIFEVPESEYWRGCPENGYVVAQAKKV